MKKMLKLTTSLLLLSASTLQGEVYYPSQSPYPLHQGSDVIYMTKSIPISNPKLKGLAVDEHLICSITSDGVVEIENKGQFKATWEDISTTRHWQIDDIMTFTPNHVPFTSFEFYVVNLTRGEYIRADFLGGPYIDHPESFLIESINFNAAEVVLVNGFGIRQRYAIDRSDMKLFKVGPCRQGETALIGRNDNWLSRFMSGCPYILTSYENANDFLYVRCNIKPL